ncbi:hypothetical protein [Paenibacillus polymyxa]|uniref:hypothetical protein n=1 Tax=Paenibacillus polymyxa TaxID=1406 RepID=UPI0023F68543|nr:hypothetical protein [Paenibacillus polymyxa]
MKWLPVHLNLLPAPVALHVSAWTMMEKPSPGSTIGERFFIRIKDPISGGTDILCDLEGGRRFSTLPCGMS